MIHSRSSSLRFVFVLFFNQFLLCKFQEATVIYINNFAFDPNLMFNIKQRILEVCFHTERLIIPWSLAGFVLHLSVNIVFFLVLIMCDCRCRVGHVSSVRSLCRRRERTEDEERVTRRRSRDRSVDALSADRVRGRREEGTHPSFIHLVGFQSSITSILSQNHIMFVGF